MEVGRGPAEAPPRARRSWWDGRTSCDTTGRRGSRSPRCSSALGATTQKTRQRKKRGDYEVDTQSGMQHITAVKGHRACHIGTVDGPLALDVTLAVGERRTVDVFCGDK